MEQKSDFEGPYFTESGGVKTSPTDRGENNVYFRALLERWAQWNKKYKSVSDISQARLRSIMTLILHCKNYDPPKRTWFDKLIKGKWFNDGDYSNTNHIHFSLDDMLGLYELNCIAYGNYEGLPIIYWNGRLHWHPNTWAVHICLRYPKLKLLLGPLILIMAGWSCVRSPIDSTTGPQLWWLRLQMLGMGETLKAYEERREMLDLCGPDGESMEAWEYTPQYYFTHKWEWDNWEHPVIKEVKEYYV